MRPSTLPFVVSVVVPSESGAETKFLQADGQLGAEETAIKFRFHTSATMVERDRINRLTHDYAGGLREFLDLERGCEAARLAVLGQIERSIWPGGRPVIEGDTDGDRQARKAQDDRMAKAWDSDDSIEHDGYTLMRSMLDRLIFLATWPVLIVDPPPAWKTLADLPLDEGVFYAIWNAWLTATEATRRGKS